MLQCYLFFYFVTAPVPGILSDPLIDGSFAGGPIQVLVEPPVEALPPF